MPYRRKRTYKRKPKRTYKRKRYSRGFSKRKGGAQIHYYKRGGKIMTDYVSGGPVSNIVSLGLGQEVVWNLAFTPSSLPSFSDFSNLYDQYRVKGLKVSFIPVANLSSFTGTTGTTGGTGVMPAGAYSVRSYSALDFNYDGSGGVTTIDQIREYNNHRWKPYNKIHSRYFYPKIAGIASNVSTEYGVTYREKPWINFDGDGVNAFHYGIKFGVDKTNAPAGTILYQVETKAYIQCRMAK